MGDADEPKRILITGGSGFLGRSLAIRLARSHHPTMGARNLEANARAASLTGCPAVPLDVSNIESVRDVFAEVRPHVVIHAAATKYVDVAERHPMSCIDVNVLGSQNVARVAIEKGVEAVVGVSTDKAAPPAGNTYGLSKALMERLLCGMDDPSATRFVCVRFGNIAWSTGSVLPEWREMLDDEGVIETTGPEMRRFFFTVDDAVDLVVAAQRHVDRLGGRILARPMKAARIGDLLEAFVERHGGTWRRGAERAGDRVDESIVGETEREFAEAIELDGRPCYVISPTVRAAQPLGGELSSATAPRLDRAELDSLVRAPGA